MPESPSRGDAAQPASKDDRGPIEYPTNQVVALLETPAQTQCAIDALLGRGFLESEIKMGRGLEEADRVEAGTGRGGFRDWMIRLFQSVGLKTAETELRDHYEQALRDGHTVIAVLALTEERRDLATQMIRECGGHFINFFGQLNVQRMPR